MSPSPKKWIPLESNPDVLNEFGAKIGLDVSKFSFCDVFGLDEVCVAWNVYPGSQTCCQMAGSLMISIRSDMQELLSMVPTPVLAVLMCFPVTEESDAAAKAGRYSCSRPGSLQHYCLHAALADSPDMPVRLQRTARLLKERLRMLPPARST